MSCKSALSNSVKSNDGNQTIPQQHHQQQWPKQSSTETNVKLAGEEAKDRLYEPKHKKKLVRVLTVVAYIFSVSLAAIMLSLYYIFIWNPYSKAKLMGDGSSMTKPSFKNCPELRNQEALAQIKMDDAFTMAPINHYDDDDDDINPTVTTTQDTLEIESFYDEASSETKIDSNEIDHDLNININIESYESGDRDILISNETAL